MTTTKKRAVKSIEVDTFQWAEMINSQFGPKSEALRCVLNVILRYMRRRNRAWPSQELIAQRAQKSRRQTQRLLDKARFDGWLFVELMRRTDNGKNWKVSVYVPTVPASLSDHVKIGEWEEDPTYRNDERELDPVLTPERGDTQMTPRQHNDRENKDNATPHRGDTQMTPPSGTEPASVAEGHGGDIQMTLRDTSVTPALRHRGVISDTSWRHLEPIEAPFEAHGGVISGTSWRHPDGALSERELGGTKREPRGERAAGAAPTSPAPISRASTESPTETPTKTPSPDPATESNERFEKLCKAIQGMPEADDATIRLCVHGSTEDEVRFARRRLARKEAG